jgi:hypothetical protein
MTPLFISDIYQASCYFHIDGGPSLRYVRTSNLFYPTHLLSNTNKCTLYSVTLANGPSSLLEDPIYQDSTKMCQYVKTIDLHRSTDTSF